MHRLLLSEEHITSCRNK